jgi:hypothetical protein
LEITPPDEIVIRSVNDAHVVLCSGFHVKWISPNKTDVVAKKGRVHVEDQSTSSSDYHSLILIFETIEEVDQGDWTCQDLNDEKRRFTMNVYSKGKTFF